MEEIKRIQRVSQGCPLTRNKEGNADLCCCYLREPDGSYTDPCPRPVDACCPTTEDQGAH
ncbi:MAG: hypothetical protein K9L59_09160 [Desulfobacterales bacterium]|nr:hypothetical protein [Desulfobacterales bacterium]